MSDAAASGCFRQHRPRWPAAESAGRRPIWCHAGATTSSVVGVYDAPVPGAFSGVQGCVMRSGPAERRPRPPGYALSAPAAESVGLHVDVYLSSSDRHPLLITVRGDVDLATADTLLVRLSTLAAPATGQIALDLAQVTFLDCAGLRALIAFEQYVRASGGSVRVDAVSPEVARLFELLGQCGASPLGFAVPGDTGRRRTVTSVQGARGAAFSSSRRDVGALAHST